MRVLNIAWLLVGSPRALENSMSGRHDSGPVHPYARTSGAVAHSAHDSSPTPVGNTPIREAPVHFRCEAGAPCDRLTDRRVEAPGHAIGPAIANPDAWVMPVIMPTAHPPKMPPERWHGSTAQLVTVRRSEDSP